MKADFRALLRSNPTVVALAPGGIAWGIRQQGSTGGYIVLQQISKTQDYGVNGRLLPTRYRVQVDCYSLTAEAVEDMGAAVLAAVDAYKIEPFLGIFLDSASDMPEGEPNRPIHRFSMDFTIVYRG